METSPIPPRPKSWDKRCVALAIEPLITEVNDWLGDDAMSEDELRDILVKHHRGDGYEFAKNLEDREGFEPNAGLVEILDGASTYSAHEKLQAEWVTAHAITIPYAIGTDVSHDRHGRCKVVDLRPATAQIVAQPENEPKFKGQERSGYILTIEEVQALDATPEVPA